MPGCDAKSRMLISARLKDKPHHVKKAKVTGNISAVDHALVVGALKICSHIIVTEDVNNELNSFLEWHNNKQTRQSANLTNLLRIDKPKNPGAKGSLQKRKELPKITKRIKRTGESETATKLQSTQPNIQPFYIKKMNPLISICHGCRQPLKIRDVVPFGYCIAKKERRQYYENGVLKTPTTECLKKPDNLLKLHEEIILDLLNI